MYELIIIGGGPAGIAAGVYAARKRLKTLFLTDEIGGQSTDSGDIQNWIGTPSISGPDLAKNFEDHLRNCAADSLEIKTKQKVTRVSGEQGNFTVTTEAGETFQSEAVLVATGSTRRQLQAPGAAEFENKGLTYCASCDGPLFAGQDVAVIGGGNAAFETAAQLLAYAKSVTLLQYRDFYKADEITINKVLSHPNMTGLLNATTKSINGDKFVSGLTYTEADGTEKNLDVTGIFVEIGLIPNTAPVADFLDLDETKRIKIDPWTGQTSVPGVWAAGDCTNVKYHQNNISAGFGVQALEDIYVHLKAR